MANYISREALLRDIEKYHVDSGGKFRHWVEIQPVADVAPVVRCRECKHSYDDISGLCCTMGPCVDCIVPEGFFCSYGERKEDTPHEQA